MTLGDALELVAGDRVCHRLTAPPLRPLRVTEVWRNDQRTIVLIRMHALAGQEWIDATGYDLPPAGMVWAYDRWISPKEWSQLFPNVKCPPIWRKAER